MDELGTGKSAHPLENKTRRSCRTATGFSLNSKSGRRDSNSRLAAWEATTLPLSYARVSGWYVSWVGELVKRRSKPVIESDTIALVAQLGDFLKPSSCRVMKETKSDGCGLLRGFGSEEGRLGG